MSISLKKNASVSLTKEGGDGLTSITLGVGWDVASGLLGGLFGGGGSIDLDASCIAFGANGQVIDTVWFQQLLSRDGSIRHSGDNLTGEGDGDDETISIDLTRLPVEIETLVFTVSSFRGQTFDKVKNAFSRVIDSRARKELARFDISESGPHTGVVLAYVKRDGGQWTFKAIGERTNARTVKDITTLAAQLI
ncbi:TerD family protein [Asticcacaulis sp. AC402]|uniref:TerD family protein n=1 Tax=Asticcacaulis sp. AC402 TaxID=1282361 RepID=UPI0003C3F04E|nr:TerD family protein [Asticcacaulis sp. AC402]ESQ73965.1 tellurium resistance protein TerZ [Asticcacaulis sp. AC402]